MYSHICAAFREGADDSASEAAASACYECFFSAEMYLQKDTTFIETAVPLTGAAFVFVLVLLVFRLDNRGIYGIFLNALYAVLAVGF